MCKDVYFGEPPCRTCQPEIHSYNRSMVELYMACGDQHIIGFEGPVGLNDVAVGHAMEFYFTVDRKDRLGLSRAVRSFYQMVLKEAKK